MFPFCFIYVHESAFFLAFTVIKSEHRSALKNVVHHAEYTSNVQPISLLHVKINHTNLIGMQISFSL